MSDPIWALRSPVGVRTLCYLNPVDGDYVLMVRREPDMTLFSERHEDLATALRRADAIYGEFMKQGWARPCA